MNAFVLSNDYECFEILMSIFFFFFFSIQYQKYIDQLSYHSAE